MDRDTVDKLKAGLYYLHAFKAVQASSIDKTAAPLVWFRTNIYLKTTKIKWTEQYQAYTSRDSLIPNGTVSASTAYNIDFGQILVVNSEAGTGDVVGRGVPETISVRNNVIGTEFTSGISQMVGDKASPLCALPLYGAGHLITMAPIQKVLVMFSAESKVAGSVTYKAFSPSGLFNFGKETEREVQYEINNGWSWGKAIWGETVLPGDELQSLLIERSVVLEDRVNYWRSIS
ncbi:hypothetical protein [Candidatus Nitrosacidococcus tergens]|uniref:Uncharacterized protein n=1 Tax=Candidatus Nitrosacidococcus tergens TaxID=553981 RepID=A0A7G1Q8Z1_9GAMM|nr:hypothetical protein [Candidatus Nitrosacidococcus tergens]CAB1275499.1 conserved protein of unknown function [Candidatus Nitrosacidococcus tergens]